MEDEPLNRAPEDFVLFLAQYPDTFHELDSVSYSFFENC